MRSALRGLTTAAVVAGLVTTSVALAVPVLATSPPAPAPSTLRLVVLHTPNVGGTCVIGVTLATAAGPVGSEHVLVQRRVVGTKAWVDSQTVLTSKTAPAKARLKTVPAVSFQARFAGSATVTAHWSNRVTCTPTPLRYGIHSAQVAQVQKKLKALHIRPATTTSSFDANTIEAVYAFQKATGLKRTGTVSSAVFARIMSTKVLKAPSWCSSSTTMCIDISQQVGYLKIGSTRFLIPVSSGGGYRFYNPQSKAIEVAHTPRGLFHVYYKVPGATTGPLGTYYWISFFTGGYGVHGSASVPAYPASHGCVREPRTIEQWVYNHLPIGAAVRVHD